MSSYGKNCDVYLNYRDWNSINLNQHNAYLEKLKYERGRRACYYRRQRALGGLLLILGCCLVIVGYAAGMSFLRYIGMAVSLFGLYTIVSKHMILVDEYYFECQDKMNMYY